MELVRWCGDEDKSEGFDARTGSVEESSTSFLMLLSCNENNIKQNVRFHTTMPQKHVRE